MSPKPRIILFLIAIFVPIGFTIKCWDCNSLINGGCGDPFKPDDFAMADCSQKHLPRFPDKDGQFCRKTTQKINDEYRVIRSCGYLNDTFTSDDDSSSAVDKKNSDGKCTRRTGTFSIMVEYCSCHSGDGCNRANSRPFNVISILFVLLTLFSVTLRFF